MCWSQRHQKLRQPITELTVSHTSVLTILAITVERYYAVVFSSSPFSSPSPFSSSLPSFNYELRTTSSRHKYHLTNLINEWRSAFHLEPPWYGPRAKQLRWVEHPHHVYFCLLIFCTVGWVNDDSLPGLPGQLGSFHCAHFPIARNCQLSCESPDFWIYILRILTTNPATSLKTDFEIQEDGGNPTCSSDVDPTWTKVGTNWIMSEVINPIIIIIIIITRPKPAYGRQGLAGL